MLKVETNCQICKAFYTSPYQKFTNETIGTMQNQTKNIRLLAEFIAEHKSKLGIRYQQTTIRNELSET